MLLRFRQYSRSKSKVARADPWRFAATPPIITNCTPFSTRTWSNLAYSVVISFAFERAPGSPHFREKPHKVNELLGSLRRGQAQIVDQQGAIYIFLVGLNHRIENIGWGQFADPAARWR